VSEFLPYVKECPSCGEEFRPEIDRCSDCGEELVTRGPDPPPGAPRERGGEPGGGPGSQVELPPGTYEVGVTPGLDFEEADRAGTLLAAAGVPFVAAPAWAGYVLYVRKEDAEKASGVLGTPPPDGAETGEEPVPSACPACGAPLPGRVEACPACGLGFGGPPSLCPRCGEVLPEDDPDCPRCAREES
jgi:hypothetical protein